MLQAQPISSFSFSDIQKNSSFCRWYKGKFYAVQSSIVFFKFQNIMCFVLQSASRYFLLESGLALLIAFLINVAVISVSGTVCSNPNISSNNKYHCTNVTLNSAALLLKVSSFIFSIYIYTRTHHYRYENNNQWIKVYRLLLVLLKLNFKRECLCLIWLAHKLKRAI